MLAKVAEGKVLRLICESNKLRYQNKAHWDSWFDDENPTPDFMVDRSQPDEQNREEFN
ncbi:antitoxin [Xenorhabdus stockiae]|uniref:Antitoxin n=2 Tax=Morganellaceae TaxID=1903414 RepID=A0A2D0KT99_9GAMM|nr:antitoxin [Xenorhabdus stockiae]PHM71782.1 antitoxin [Xenorhabdus sp. KJ12.1]